MAPNKNESTTPVMAVHMECVRNRSSDFNRFIPDGCMLYAPGNDLECAACGCHRNFHRRVAVDLLEPVNKRARISESSRNSSTAREVSPETAIQVSSETDTEDVPPAAVAARDAEPAEVRRRTRVSREQILMIKEVMERNNWKMFRFYSQEEVQRICSEIGINRMILKNWIYRLRREIRVNNEAARD